MIIAGLVLLVVIAIGLYYYYYGKSSSPSGTASAGTGTSSSNSLASDEVRITFYPTANYAGASQTFKVKRVGSYFFAFGNDCSSGSTGVIGFKPNSFKIENYKASVDRISLRGYHGNPGDNGCGPSASPMSGLPTTGSIPDIYVTGTFGQSNSSWLRDNTNGGYVLTLGSA